MKKFQVSWNLRLSSVLRPLRNSWPILEKRSLPSPRKKAQLLLHRTVPPKSRWERLRAENSKRIMLVELSWTRESARPYLSPAPPLQRQISRQLPRSRRQAVRLRFFPRFNCTFPNARFGVTSSAEISRSFRNAPSNACAGKQCVLTSIDLPAIQPWIPVEYDISKYNFNLY